LSFGVIGFGKIGKNMLKKANALKFSTMAYDPYVDAFFMEEEGVKKVEFSEIIQEADVLSIQVPLNEETYHIIGEDELKSMKRTAILINTSRGPQVDNNALAKALEQGWIAAAALDDIEDEPAKKEHWEYEKNPLLKLDNCLITPHSAYYSEESLVKARSTAAEEVKRVLMGEGARYIV
jgi:D-3-phosphoglycerate dehydrogenase